MADPSLNSRQRDGAITSKLMEGPYPGIGLFVTEKKIQFPLNNLMSVAVWLGEHIVNLINFHT